MDHTDLTVSTFLENVFGPKRFNINLNDIFFMQILVLFLKQNAFNIFPML